MRSHLGSSCLVLLAALVGASRATAQSFNLRYTGPISTEPGPSPTFGAATGQAGEWNAIVHYYFTAPAPAVLLDLAGQPTAARVTSEGCDVGFCAVDDDPDIQGLLGRHVNGDCFRGTETLIEGLEPGRYALTLYGEPCFGSLKNVQVELKDGSFDQTVAVGGPYDGTFDTMTLGELVFDVAGGVDVAILMSENATLCAMQLTQLAGPETYCDGKTSSAGCLAQIGTSEPSFQPISAANDYSVTATGLQGLKNGHFFVGISGQASLPFLGGTLCVQPPTKRGPTMNSGGSGPSSCDGSFQLVVNDGVLIPMGMDAGSGQSAWYQVWYRDPNGGAGLLGSALSDAVRLDFE